VTLASTPIARLVLVVGAVLIALGEVPRVVEPDRLAWIVPLDALFHSSAVGGTLVLTGVGHVTTRALLRAREVGRAATVFTLLRVLALLWVLQLAVLVMVAVARAVDTLAPPDNLSGEVWSTVLTFRWNLWLTSHMLEVPGELIGLALPRRWNGVAVAIAAGLATVVVAGLRVMAVDRQDPYVLLLDTFARSDGFFIGVLAACVAGLGRRAGSAVSGAALVVLVGAILASDFVSTDQHLVIQLPMVAMLAGLALLDPGDQPSDSLMGLVARSTHVDALAVVWAPLVACVTPAAVVVGRRTEMHWVLRVTVLLIVVAIIARVALALAERVRLPDGPPPTLSGMLAGWRRVLAEADAEVRGYHGARSRSGPGDDAGGNGAV
jgi:hypothetical protein